jgi:preprotein translocase subunit SecG
METVHTLLMVVQVLTAVVLIGFILIQQGKGADAGAAFGSGASATVFGARGSGNFLSRTTAVLATIFLANSLALAWIAKERVLRATGVMQGTVTAPAETAPAPAAPAQSVPANDTAMPEAPAAEQQGAPVESGVPTAPQ